MKVKNPPMIIGDLDWEELRNLLIAEMSFCSTEKQFVKCVSNLLASVGTLNQIKKTRKSLGIKPLTKEQEKKLKKLEKAK